MIKAAKQLLLQAKRFPLDFKCHVINVYFQGISRFHYRGCGWKPKQMTWCMSTMRWISTVNGLFDSIFGPDFMEYDYPGDGKTCVVGASTIPKFLYHHESWEKGYPLENVAG